MHVNQFNLMDLPKKNRIMYLINIVVLTLILVFSLGVTSSSTVSPQVGILLIVLFILQPLKIKIQSMFFLLPFQTTLVVYQSISLIIVLQMILIVALLLKNINIKKKHVLLLLVLFFLQLLSSIVYDANLIGIITLGITFFLISLLTQYFSKDEVDNFSLYSKSLIFGLVLALLIALVPNMSSLFSDGFIGRFSGLWTNPNILGMQLILAIVLILILFFERKISSLTSIFLIVFLGFLITLTASRSAIFVLSIVSIIVLVMKIREKKIKNIGGILKIFLLFILYIIIILLAYIFIMDPIIENRGILSSQEDFSAGRLTLLKENFIWIIQEKGGLPLFIGLGVENNLTYMSQHGYLTLGTHNTFAEMLLSAGVLGFLIWLFFLKSIISNQGSLFNYRLLIVYVFFIYSFSAHLNTSTFVYMVLTLIACTRPNSKT